MCTLFTPSEMFFTCHECLLHRRSLANIGIHRCTILRRRVYDVGYELTVRRFINTLTSGLAFAINSAMREEFLQPIQRVLGDVEGEALTDVGQLAIGTVRLLGPIRKSFFVHVVESFDALEIELVEWRLLFFGLVVARKTLNG